MLKLLFQAQASAFQSRDALVAENLALRHQIEVLQRNCTRPGLQWRDRAFWDILSCIWPSWRSALYVVQPDTVIRWHRQGFRFYWRWKSRPRRPGRPRIPREIRNLIRDISLANPTWGAPRIHGELLKLGIDLHQDTVSSYMAKPTRPPSQTWRTFLTNHAKDIASFDFFTVPTATFRVLYVFLVLDNASRRLGLPPGLPAIGPAPSDAQEIGRLGYSEGTGLATGTPTPIGSTSPPVPCPAA